MLPVHLPITKGIIAGLVTINLLLISREVDIFTPFVILVPLKNDAPVQVYKPIWLVLPRKFDIPTTSKDAGKIKNVAPSMMKFPKKPSMKKEEYGISGNKVSSTLLDAINQVTKEGSIKGSGTDRKAVLKKAFRAGEDDTRRFYSGKKPTIKPPKGMRDLKKFDAKHKDKGIQKAFAGGRAAGDGDTTIKGKARMKPQSNLPLNKYQRQGIKIDKKDKADTAAYVARTKGK